MFGSDDIDIKAGGIAQRRANEGGGIGIDSVLVDGGDGPGLLEACCHCHPMKFRGCEIANLFPHSLLECRLACLEGRLHGQLLRAHII